MRWMVGFLAVLLLSVDGWGCAAAPAPKPVSVNTSLGTWCCEDLSASWATCGFDKQSAEAWVYGKCWNAEEVHLPEVKPVFQDVPEFCFGRSGRCDHL